jgi:hypothetical protein
MRRMICHIHDKWTLALSVALVAAYEQTLRDASYRSSLWTFSHNLGSRIWCQALDSNVRHQRVDPVISILKIVCYNMCKRLVLVLDAGAHDPRIYVWRRTASNNLRRSKWNIPAWHSLFLTWICHFSSSSLSLSSSFSNCPHPEPWNPLRCFPSCHRWRYRHLDLRSHLW